MKKFAPHIVIDPDDVGCMVRAGDPGWNPKRVVDLLDEAIPAEGDPCLLDGRPCILFALWDYAEDWSGAYIRELHPFQLIGAPRLALAEFWALVRKVHGVT